MNLGPSSRHLFKIPQAEGVNYVKLNMYPDGGIVRPIRFMPLTYFHSPTGTRLDFACTAWSSQYFHQTGGHLLILPTSLRAGESCSPLINTLAWVLI